MSIDSLLTTISSSTLTRLPINEKPRSEVQADQNSLADAQADATKSRRLDLLT